MLVKKCSFEKKKEINKQKVVNSEFNDIFLLKKLVTAVLAFSCGSQRRQPLRLFVDQLKRARCRSGHKVPELWILLPLDVQRTENPLRSHPLGPVVSRRHLSRSWYRSELRL